MTLHQMALGQSIGCGHSLTGSIVDNSSSVSWAFDNDQVRDVTFTNCHSDFDPTLYLLDSAGNTIQWMSINKCDGDDCSDTAYCGTSLRETFTMEQLEEDTYTLLLTPFSVGGEYSVTVYCDDEPASSDLIHLKFTGWEPSDPLDICEGDCDSDDDCDSGLICFFNDGAESNVPDGCTGTAEEGVDYCYDPSSATTWYQEIVGMLIVYMSVRVCSLCVHVHVDCIHIDPSALSMIYLFLFRFSPDFADRMHDDRGPHCITNLAD